MEAARMRDENAAQAADDKPEAAPEPPAAPTARVVETLICTGLGEPLYHADCADVNARVELLQRIAQQAGQLAQMLPLGIFDRVEMQFTDERAIAQARLDRLVYVRTVNEPASS
jgi:hypothetical protein